MIARKSMIILLQNVLGGVLGLFGLFIIARVWGGFAPTALGIIGVAMSVVGIFGFIADLGFSQAHIKRVSEGKDLGQCIGTYLFVKILLLTLMTAITLASVYIWKDVLNKEFYDATTESVVYVFLLYTIVSNLLSIPNTTFLAKTEIVKTQLSSIADILVRIVTTVLVVICGVTGISVVAPSLGIDAIPPYLQFPSFLEPLTAFIASHAVGSLAMTYVFGITANLVVALFLFRRYPISRPDMKLLKSYAAFALPIFLISVLATLSANIDRVMIGWFWASDEAGFYFTAQRIMAIMMTIPGAVSLLLFPTYSAHHASNNFKEIQDLNRTALRYMSMILLPVIMIVLLFPGDIINLIGASLTPAALTTSIFSLYVFLQALMASYSGLISGINRPDVGASIGALICIANIVLNYLFIPSWGLLAPLGIVGAAGAAAATLLSTALGLVLLIYYSNKFVGTNFVEKPIIVQLIAASITGAVLYGISKSSELGFGADRLYTLVAYCFLCLGIYLGLLYIFKEFTKKDWNFFMATINPKELLAYVRDELRGSRK